MNLLMNLLKNTRNCLEMRPNPFLKVLTPNLKGLSIESAEIKLSKRCFESGTPG